MVGTGREQQQRQGQQGQSGMLAGAAAGQWNNNPSPKTPPLPQPWAPPTRPPCRSANIDHWEHCTRSTLDMYKFKPFPRAITAPPPQLASFLLSFYTSFYFLLIDKILFLQVSFGFHYQISFRYFYPLSSFLVHIRVFFVMDLKYS